MRRAAGDHALLSCWSYIQVRPPAINKCKLSQIMVRSRSPYQWRPGSNVLKKNLVRLAEVWLDEFKEIYYERINNKLGDLGDLSQRKILRNNLRCKRLL